MTELSVIVPLGPAETGLGRLAADLLLLPNGTEIVLVGCGDNRVFGDRQRLQQLLHRHHLRWLQADTGRGRQMNAGAEAATGRWLWFLHADSGFGPELWVQLQQQLIRKPESLHYCQLAFMNDGPGAMKANQWGANLRSRWLGVPFGDQGFCLSKALFQRLGGYPEDAAYGEDHLLVWRARQCGVPLNEVPAPLSTSARKYRQQGWGPLTLKYQYRWLKQALPQWWRC